MWLVATMLGIIPALVVSTLAWLATWKWLGITGITPQLARVAQEPGPQQV